MSQRPFAEARRSPCACSARLIVAHRRRLFLAHGLRGAMAHSRIRLAPQRLRVRQAGGRLAHRLARDAREETAGRDSGVRPPGQVRWRMGDPCSMETFARQTLPAKSPLAGDDRRTVPGAAAAPRRAADAVRAFVSYQDNLLPASVLSPQQTSSGCVPPIAPNSADWRPIRVRAPHPCRAPWRPYGLAFGPADAANRGAQGGLGGRNTADTAVAHQQIGPFVRGELLAASVWPRGKKSWGCGRPIAPNGAGWRPNSVRPTDPCRAPWRPDGLTCCLRAGASVGEGREGRAMRAAGRAGAGGFFAVPTSCLHPPPDRAR
jgi:hypothetical protein